ncbi:MAG: ADP-forming succinate--CoA ligase subunit beta [Gammaproteobacteria bacterium]|nr:ADP-forming succinate--CoA ligase subunit beta [Gammaproteobacteria bacterium]
MNLHEYQSKTLFAQYNIAVPEHRVISQLSEVNDKLSELGGQRWVVKAQVHAGGRGKAGGVKVTESKAEVEAFVASILGTNLVTFQTDEKGQPVNKILIEQPCDIERELYLGAVVDRALRQVVFMASTEGGVEIEKVAEESPEKILKVAINPLVGIQGFQCRDLGFALGLNAEQIKQFSRMLTGLAKIFIEKDLSLLEINPLVVTKQGDLLCLDAKITIDESALYRHPELQGLRDISQEDAREVRAKEWDLNYISLDGEIGCMVNGAGLAMATMDLIKLHGSEPANFLDVGGTATKERVAEAFKIILSDDKVKGILVNIFGGIVRCDIIAEGIAAAVAEVGVNVPVVVRLEGNNAKLGLEILDSSPLKIETAHNLNDAAEKIVKQVNA